METKKASEYYRHPDYLFNCTQAIVYKWAELLKLSSLKAANYRSYGSGRAPEGMCGALYGALELFDKDVIKKNHLKNGFKQQIGSQDCHAIRIGKLASCKECIDVVDDLVDQIIQDGQ